MTTMTPFTIAGNIVDVHQHRIFYGSIRADQGIIADIEEIDEQERAGEPYLLPGFIDSHVHIESSMLTPSEFARLAVTHGTVATVSDPHEIANVCGRKGVDFMIQNGKLVNFKFYFGAPSCVPATVFETAGGALRPEEVRRLLSDKHIRYLSEMMNFPGVLAGDPEAMEKIQAAHLAGKPIDGHAPALRGEALARYVAAGISTDHECFTREEALDKLRQGMKILIREGSAAKNFDALISLLSEYPKQMMFCSDDKHPDSLTRGHINELCRRAAEAGIPLFDILDAACVNPVVHYGLEVGLLRKGDPADFIVVEDLRSFAIRRTYINGELTAENGLSLIRGGRMPAINNFSCDLKKPADFSSPAPDYLLNNQLPVIEALDGQLLTNCLWLEPKIEDGAVVSDIARDILKIAVVNRYTDAPPAIAFIRNFGLRSGAIASSVAHDSHNIIAVGSDDDSLCDAVNLIIETQGGISCLSGDERAVLPLPVAGLMSDDDGYLVADAYTRIDAMAKSLGSTLSAPFMTLSFMALLVIPSLKLSDLGLFDGARFQFVLPKDRLR